MLEPALTQRLETLWRMESPVLIARLARLLGGDVGRAEELAQDTWLAALERWPEQGIPDNPGAWLMTTARNRAIDVLRQHQRVAQQHAQWGEELHPAALPAPDDSQALEDDLGDDLLAGPVAHGHDLRQPGVDEQPPGAGQPLALVQRVLHRREVADLAR